MLCFVTVSTSEKREVWGLLFLRLSYGFYLIFSNWLTLIFLSLFFPRFNLTLTLYLWLFKSILLFQFHRTCTVLSNWNLCRLKPAFVMSPWFSNFLLALYLSCHSYWKIVLLLTHTHICLCQYIQSILFSFCCHDKGQDHASLGAIRHFLHELSHKLLQVPWISRASTILWVSTVLFLFYFTVFI